MGRKNRYRKGQKDFFFPGVEIVKCGNKPEGSSKRWDVGKEKGRKKENGVRKHNHEQAGGKKK